MTTALVACGFSFLLSAVVHEITGKPERANVFATAAAFMVLVAIYVKMP